jgi:cellulose synthase/poly-beta-1,6-N-acetylglucosamine synthase-like glycosyltransferase
MNTILAASTVGAMALTGWHHVAWPLLLKRMAKPTRTPALLADAELPAVTIVMPAYNEAAHIAAKIHNIAALKYPADRLFVVIACDGCTDGTAAIARAALADAECAHLQAEVLDHTVNRGKVAVLNETIAAVTTEVVVLTDVSAMLAADALLRTGAHFADPRLGAVGGTYKLTRAGSAGEAKYWQVQIAVKRGEAALGAPLGLHGAMYAFRRAAWAPLPADTINDDFILPTEIFGRGWRVAYDETIVAWEAEVSNPAMEQRRRRRIAAGNAQQLWRLLWLLNPRHGGVALAFASGKALRVLMPFLICAGVLGCAAEAIDSVEFAALLGLQLAGLAAAALAMALGERAPKLLAIARYIVAGHTASLIGTMRYATGHDRKPWRRAAAV